MNRRLLLLFATSTRLLCSAAEPDPEGFVPLSRAITARVEASQAVAPGLAGYLGISLEDSGLGIAEVAPDSPASAAGLQKGDLIASINNRVTHNPDEARGLVQAIAPGSIVHLELRRKDHVVKADATMAATSRPLKPSNRVVLGVRMGEPREEGIPVVAVFKDDPAAKAGVHQGDLMLSVDGADLGEARLLADVLSEKKAGDVVNIHLRRKGGEMDMKATLINRKETDPVPEEERRELNTWKKPVFRIALIPIEFEDTKHNDKIVLENWQEAFFSKGTYNKTNALGQTVYGSMNDYYQEASCGKLSITGKAFPWVKVDKKRSYYAELKARGVSKGGLLMEVMDKLLAREGAKALDDFDGLGFIYSGEKGPEISRGNIFWPHRSTLRREGKAWSYVIIPELKRGKMSDISTMCHETGHSLGLPDLYARPENPGSEGAGRWCIMSNQAGNGRPQHFSAWSKEQLGWLQPVVVDPAVKQKLILGPVEGSATECLKVLLRRDGSEYFLLENRRKSGFDTSLPAEGLLIWRVVNNRPILEESHGVTGPSGPRVFLPSVPYPSKANSSFTPYTTPSSRSQLGGGLPVYISNIRRLPDGRIALEVGYQYE
jgi:M6 family metalloprotease-like protein